MSKSQVRARILEILHREYTSAELEAESLGLKRLGLIPEKTDYVQLMVGLLQEQIAGFYDQNEKKLYIAGWAQAGGDMLMAHELDHALQDQHFDLVTFMKVDKSNGDAAAARQALVEGDGMALMLEFQMAAMKQAPPWGNPLVMRLLKNGMAEGSNGMKNVPLALREGLLFPYAGGVEFIAHFRKQHSWKTIDAMYKKPPLSTEQILHPAKYESYEKPISIQPGVSAPLALVGYTQQVSDVIGEKGIELFLRTHGVAMTRAVSSAAGWGGDRYVVYAFPGHVGTSPQGTVGVWMSAWDEEVDAKEFMESLEHALPKFSGVPRRGTSDVLRYNGKEGEISAERHGSSVLLVMGVSASGADVLRAEVWKNWAIARARTLPK